MTQTLKTAMIKKLKTTIFTAKIMMNKEEEEDYLEALRETLKVFDKIGFSTSKANLWSEIETRKMTVIEIYENFNYSPDPVNKKPLRKGVLSFLFELQRGNTLDTLELTRLLRKHIATMLNDHLGSSIDLAVAEKDTNFLEDKVPKHLESWRDTDKELLFNKLWEILENLGFYNEEICKAWTERLYKS
jgi:hypothetical protein